MAPSLRLVLTCFLILSCTDDMAGGDDVPFERLTAEDHPVAAGIVDADEIGPGNISLNASVSAADAMAGAFRPRKDLDAYRFDGAVDWRADPFGDANWRFQLQALRGIDPLLLAYEREGDVEALEVAADVALQWLAAHPSAPQKKPYTDGRSMAWQDMATGLRALRLAYLVQEARQGSLALTSDQRAALVEGVQRHVDILSRPDFFKSGNHGIFIAHGLMAACRVLPNDAPCQEARAYARDRMASLVVSQFNADGGHAEHSPTYHGFVFRTFEQVLSTDWYQLDAEPKARLDKARDVYGWLADANGDYPNVGDSERVPNRRATQALPPQAGCARRGADERAACYGAQYLPDTGYAVLRTAPNVAQGDRTSFFFTCGRHSGTHKHADDLSFEFMAKGVYVIVDGGKYLYADDPLRQHLLSRAAHSTLQLRANPDEATSSGGCLTRAALEGSLYTAEGMLQLNKNTAHARRISYDLGTSLEIVDTIEQRGRPSAYGVRWLLGPRVLVQQGEEAWHLVHDDKAVAVFRPDPACTWRVVSGEAATAPKAGWYSESYSQIQSINVIDGQCPANLSRVTSSFGLDD